MSATTWSLRGRRRGWWTFLIGAAVSAGALLLILRGANLPQTWAALRASQLLWVALALALQLLAMLAMARRWQALLAPYPTRFLALTQILFIAHLLNTVLPAKLGTVARVLLAAESERLNGGFVLGSVALEKGLDTLVMLVMLALLAPFIPLPLWLREPLSASILLVLLGVALLASVNRLRAPLLKQVGRWERRVRGPKAQGIEELARGILESIANLTRRRQALPVLAWTAVIWLLGGAVSYGMFVAVGIAVPWSAAWFLIVVLQLGTRVPALPANLGVFHYLVVLALGVYGVNPSAALAYAILLHLVVFLLPAVLGGLCALPLSARLSALVGRPAPKASG